MNPVRQMLRRLAPAPSDAACLFGTGAALALAAYFGRLQPACARRFCHRRRAADPRRAAPLRGRAPCRRSVRGRGRTAAVAPRIAAAAGGDARQRRLPSCPAPPRHRPADSRGAHGGGRGGGRGKAARAAARADPLRRFRSARRVRPDRRQSGAGVLLRSARRRGRFGAPARAGRSRLLRDLVSGKADRRHRRVPRDPLCRRPGSRARRADPVARHRSGHGAGSAAPSRSSCSCRPMPRWPGSAIRRPTT